MNLKKIGFLLVGTILSVMLAACGEADISKVDAESKAKESEKKDTEKKEKPEEQKLKVGESVIFDGLTITLNEVRIEKGGEFDEPEQDKFVVVNLTAENTTDEEQIVSSVMNIELKDADGYSYTTTFLTEGIKGQFDGSIEVGGKLRGEIPFDVPDSDEYQLHFGNPFKKGKAIWVIPASEL